MDTIKERFRTVRKSLNKNQEEWGKILGITRAGVSDIESGRRNVTEKHIKLLCVEPIDGKIISEEYLRTGDGDMFISIPEVEETAMCVSELIENPDDPFCQLIIEVMKVYSELSPKSKKVFSESARKLRDNLAKKREG